MRHGGKLNQATIKDYAALIEKVKAGDVAAVPDFVPVTPAPVTETCASKKLPVGKLSDLISYGGDYKYQNNVVFNLDATTGKVIAPRYGGDDCKKFVAQMSKIMVRIIM